MNAIRLACAAVAAFGTFATTSLAKTVTFEFTADGSGEQVFDVGGERAQGGTLTGRFSWDLSAQDRHGGDLRGIYHANTTLTFSIIGGPQDGSTFSATDYGTSVNHGSNQDGISSRSLWIVDDAYSNGTSATFVTFLQDVDKVSDDLPASEAELSLDDWDIYAVVQDLDVGGTASRYYSYRLTDLHQIETAPVPLPASLPIMLLGIGALGAFARTRKTAA